MGPAVVRRGLEPARPTAGSYPSLTVLKTLTFASSLSPISTMRRCFSKTVLARLIKLLVEKKNATPPLKQKALCISHVNDDEVTYRSSHPWPNG